MDKYVVEWRFTALKSGTGAVPQSNWDKYPQLPIFVDVTMAVQKAEEAMGEWNRMLEGTFGQYEFRVRHTTTEFIKIEV